MDGIGSMGTAQNDSMLEPQCHPWKIVRCIANIAQVGDHDLEEHKIVIR